VNSHLTSACCRIGFPLRFKPTANAGVRGIESESSGEKEKEANRPDALPFKDCQVPTVRDPSRRYC